MRRDVLFGSFLCLLLILSFWRCLDADSQDPVIYLPLIRAAPRPALGGVGLSGPYAAVVALGTQWYYNWSWKQPVSAPIPDPRFVPMIWGRGSMNHLAEAVATARAGGGYLLLFNEPDHEGQANISPEDAAGLLHQIEQQAANVRLVSPAPSQLDPDWLWRMVAEYEARYGEKPRLDAIAAHYYCWEGDWTKARDYLISVRQQALAHGYDVPIWLTEFGGECWKADNHNEEIMRNLIPWMKSQPWMGRYAWFASMLPDPPATEDLKYCSLTNPETGELTELGELYGSFE